MMLANLAETKCGFQNDEPVGMVRVSLSSRPDIIDFKRECLRCRTNYADISTAGIVKFISNTRTFHLCTVESRLTKDIF